MRPEPKFCIGESVMVRSQSSPQKNRDFGIVIEAKYGYFRDVSDNDIGIRWSYKLHNDTDAHYWNEVALRPIPKEEPNGIDAEQYIKDLCTRSPEVVA